MTLPAPVNPKTLRLLLDLTKGTPAEQVKLAAQLDAKTIQLTAAASVLIGLTAAAAPEDSNVPWWLVLVAVLPYIAVVVAAVYGVWVRKFEVADDPQTLWETLYDVEPDEARHAVVDRLADGYANNEKQLDSKRAALTVALVGVALEVVLVASALMVALA